MNSQMQNPHISDYSSAATLCPESWKMYFDRASAYMDAASTLAAANLFDEARRLLDLAREANRVCRDNFDSANRR